MENLFLLRIKCCRTAPFPTEQRSPFFLSTFSLSNGPDVFLPLPYNQYNCRGRPRIPLADRAPYGSFFLFFSLAFRVKALPFFPPPFPRNGGSTTEGGTPLLSRGTGDGSFFPVVFEVEVPPILLFLSNGMWCFLRKSFIFFPQRVSIKEYPSFSVFSGWVKGILPSGWCERKAYRRGRVPFCAPQGTVLFFFL